MTTSVRTKDIPILELADALIAQVHERNKNFTLSIAGKITSAVSGVFTCFCSWYCLPVSFGGCLFSAYEGGQHSKNESQVYSTVRVISSLLAEGAEDKPLHILPIQEDFTRQYIDPRYQRKIHDHCTIFSPDQSTELRAYIGSLVPSSTEGVGFLMPAIEPHDGVSSYYLDGRTIIVAHYGQGTRYYDLYRQIIMEAKDKRINTLSIALGEWMPIHSTEMIVSTLREEEYRGYFKEVHLIFSSWSLLRNVEEVFEKTDVLSNIQGEESGYDSDD